ncbi:MAG: maleate cis-trans isomerase family protein [Hyphomicrobiaceae bacterium]
MLRPDNWGWRARIGMFIVANEAVPEAEWWAMAPVGVSVHAARITARTPWATWDNDRASVELQDDLRRGCEQFAAMRLSAVVIGHSSSSIVGGEGWDGAVVARLAENLPDNVVVTTNGLDCQAALSAAAIRRPFLVFPAWFNEQTIATGMRYFSEHGYDAAGHLHFDPGRQWRDLPPGELYPQGMGFAQDVEALYRQIRKACPSEADGVLIVGTGFRCVGLIDVLENELARPVLTANQVSLWHCLRQCGIRAAISGYGSLFAK